VIARATQSGGGTLPATGGGTCGASPVGWRAGGARRADHPRRRGAAIALVTILVGALALALAGCGESKEEKAKKTVCNARSDIQKRTQTLKGLTPSVATLPQIKTELTAIFEDVKKIGSAQEDLAPARKEQVKKATETFKHQLESVPFSSIGPQLVSQLRPYAEQLERSYTQALGPIECS
jgi:hypothetical protein